MKITVMPWRDEAAQGLEELAAFLRRQHRRRLVEDDDARAADQHLEDLDALLDADGEQPDALGRIDLKAELPGQRRGLLDLGSVVDQPVRQYLHAEEDVVGDRQRRHELEVLMHHADAGGDGAGRTGQRHAACRRSRSRLRQAAASRTVCSSASSCRRRSRR